MRSTFALAALAVASAAIPPYNIVQRLELIPDTSTLVTAVVAGGLAAALSGPGPFTVFAPDNFAFQNLPPGVLPALLANKTLLDEVLTYHVVAGNVSSFQLKDGEDVPTLNKAHNITVEINRDPRDNRTFVTLDRYAQVTYADNYATNGVFHIIDHVLIPRARMSEGLKAVFDAGYAMQLQAAAKIGYPQLNLVQRLVLIPEFSILVQAVVAGGLATALSGPGPFTLFAPNDFAFQQLPPGAIERLLANKTELDDVLTYHVAAGNVSSTQLTDGEEIEMLNKGNVSVGIFKDPRTGEVVVELDHHSRVLNVDNYVTNGVFHEISEVLFPRHH